MTREDAIFFLNGLRSNNNCDETIDMAIAALRGPVPDSITGLVPCGCGGKAVFDSAYGDDEVESSYTAEVYCELCEIRTPIFRENADVKAAWNRAMGWRVEG